MLLFFSFVSLIAADVSLGSQLSVFAGKTHGVIPEVARAQWAVFRNGLNSSLTGGRRPLKPTPSDRKHAKSLLSRVRVENGNATSGNGERHSRQQQQIHHGQPATASDPHAFLSEVRESKTAPFTLIKDIKPGSVVSLMGSVLEVDGNYSGRCVIYITDYTTNESLVDYGQYHRSRLGDEYGYLERKSTGGLRGQMSLQVTLWAPHDAFARQSLELNSLVHLSYVQIKQKKGFGGYIEASVHTDRMFPQKMHIHAVDAKDDPRAKELLRRRREFWKRERPSDEEEHLSKNKRRKAEREKRRQDKLGEGQKTLESNLPRFGLARTDRAASHEHAVANIFPENKYAPFSLIKDIKPGSLVSLVGNVLGLDGSFPDRCVIYITDYTSNESLVDYGHQLRLRGLDGENAKGPSGRMTLQVTLWEPHDAFARESLELNGLVRLTYVQVKQKKGFDGYIEASVHTDRMFPEKLHVHTVDAREDPHARELLQRKKEYWKGECAGKREWGKGMNGTCHASRAERAEKIQESEVEGGQKSLASERILPKYQYNENSEACCSITDI